MTALTAGRNTLRRDGVQYAYDASAECFAGGLVMIDTTTGLAAPAKVGGGKVVGVAESGCKIGEKVPVWRGGVFAFDTTDITIADIGKPCYVVDDQTVSSTGAAADAAGIISDVEIIDVTVRVWVNPAY